MRIIHCNIPLPSDWYRHPGARIQDECDIRLSHDSKLRVKVCVFANQKALRDTWKAVLGKRGESTRGALGICTELSMRVERFDRKKARPGEAISFKESSCVKVDPRYVCAIGLLAGNLGVSVICHEAVHAAFAYARRTKRLPYSQENLSGSFEEYIAYPAGEIAKLITKFLWSKGYYNSNGTQRKVSKKA